MVEKWIGKLAVVTGASSGIGAAIFSEFAKSGINVVGLARRSEKIEDMIKELGPTKGKMCAFKCDVSDPGSVTAAFKWIESELGDVNILVNNAGIARNVNVLDDGEEAFKKLNEVIDTNVRGLTQCTREAFRLMKKSDDYGLIININSILGHSSPFTGFSNNIYPASKHAVTALTEQIRQELVLKNNKKVRVTSLSPGFVETEIVYSSGFLQRNDEFTKTFWAEMPALKSEDVAHSIMFVLSTPYTVNISELTIKPVGEKM